MITGSPGAPHTVKCGANGTVPCSAATLRIRLCNACSWDGSRRNQIEVIAAASGRLALVPASLRPRFQARPGIHPPPNSARYPGVQSVPRTSRLPDQDSGSTRIAARLCEPGRTASRSVLGGAVVGVAQEHADIAVPMDL